ncbi:MAG: TIGR01841 family phasin [Candidatus Competibacterales bacterium]|nr:TIGR01841 family phasin [Candidatus Competibacterales bacterium]
MKYDLFDTVSKQQETFVATLQKLNKLAVGNVEKLSSLQMDNLRSYSDQSLRQLKTLAEVKNVEQFQSYLQSQGEVAKSIGEKLVADAKVIADMGAEYNKEAQKITRESIEAVTPKAA